MSYNTRFFFRFESDAGREFRIDIKQDGFSGTAVQRPLGASPTLRRDDAENGIRGTSLEIIAECNTDNEFAALYTSDARKFYVELIDVDGNTVLWDGFVSPELYAAPEIAPPYDVQITVVDGLGELKRQKFPGGGRKSILAHLQTILGYSGLGVGNADIVIIDSLHCTEPSVSAAGLLGSIYTDLDHFVEEDLNCYDALESILRTLNLTITRISGKRWILMRESDVEVESGSVAAKTASGTSVSLLVPKYGSMVSSQWWPVGNMANEIEPAKKQLATALAYVMRNSMLNDGDMNDSSAWTSQRVTFQDGFAKMSGDSINRLPATLSQSISVSQYDSPLRLIIAAQHSVPIILSGDVDVKAYIKIKLESSGTTQYLQKLAGENLAWTTREKDFQFIVPLTLNGSGTTEFAWSIPNIPADGTLTLEIKVPYYGSAPYHVWVDYIHLLQTAPFGYMDTVIIDNDARGKLDESVLAFGDSPYVANALQNLKNIVSTSNSTLVEEWATAQFEGVLLSVMAMDRALAVALPRLWAKGTLHVPDATTLPFAIESPEDLPMIVRRASWNLLDDEIDVDLLSIPSADVEIDTETIAPMTESQAAEAGGSGGGSGSGGSGGGSSSGGALYEYFEDVENSDGERIGIKSIYDLHIIQEAADEEQWTPEVTKDITEILRHLALQVIGEGTEEEETILVTDLTLASTKNLIAGGIGGGSEPGGGGSIATLADVALGSLAAGDILHYNATTSHWENVQPSLALLTDVALGTPTDGQALIWDATLGKWRPGTVASTGGIASVGLTMPTGFAVAGSPLTSDGTLQVSFAAGYALPTTADVTKGTTAYGWGNHASAGYLTSVAFSDLTSHPTTLSGYGITDAKISGGTITLGGNTITPLASVAFGDLTSHPTTLSGYGITDAKISGGTITLGANTITPLTDVSVVSGDNTIGTSLTTIGQVQGVNIRAKIAAYLLAADFTALNIVSTLGTTAVNRATADASGNTITSSYLRKDTDDTMSANLTIGQPNLSGSKTLTIYGRNNDTTPALTIYGVASATTRYATKIYRDSTAMHIDSSVSITGNIIATGYIDSGLSPSDRRLKKDIKTMDFAEATHVLAALRPVTFAWNEKASELGQFAGDSRGFIADEYNCIIGNATRKMWGEYDAIDYNQVIPYLVAGWQLQQRRIEALTGGIEKLRRRLGDGI